MGISRCVLVILIILNIIFIVLGLGFLGVGLWLRFSQNTRGIFSPDLDSSAFETGVYVLTGLGPVMVVVGTLGEVVASRKKRWAQQVFSILLFLLAVTVILLGILLYDNRDKTGQTLGAFYSSMYDQHLKDPNNPIFVTLNFIQTLLHCCGVTGTSCVQKNNMPTCPGIISTSFNSLATLVLGVFAGTGALSVVGVICSTVLGLLIVDPDPSPTLKTFSLPSLQPVYSNSKLDDDPYNIYSNPKF